MLKSGILLMVIAISILLLPSTLVAQTRPGTVAESWGDAPSQASKPASPSEGTVWQNERSPASRPWPSMPEHPASSDYSRANTMVIDSLAKLYCVSTSYLHTLRQRNERASSVDGTSAEGKQFAYTAPAAPPQGRESLQTLYKELLSLLDRCIHGR